MIDSYTPLSFLKMQGGGSDYMLLDGLCASSFSHFSQNCLSDTDCNTLAKDLCRRRFSVGADGLILLLPPKHPRHHGRIKLFDAKGKETYVCGSALRCAGSILFEKGLFSLPPKEQVHAEPFLYLESSDGVKSLTLQMRKGVVSVLTVRMEAPIFSPSLPFGFPFVYEGYRCLFYSLSLGISHAVLFCKEANELAFLPLRSLIGRLLSPEEGTVITLATLPENGALHLRSDTEGFHSETAAAVTAAVVRACLWPKETPLAVKQEGGCLSVTVEERGGILVRGAVSTVYEGNRPGMHPQNR